LFRCGGEDETYEVVTALLRKKFVCPVPYVMIYDFVGLAQILISNLRGRKKRPKMTHSDLLSSVHVFQRKSSWTLKADP
jgi:hypothetical protein